MIASAFVLTGIYVSKANSKYDALIRRIVERLSRYEKALLRAGGGFFGWPANSRACGWDHRRRHKKQAINWTAIGMFVAFVGLHPRHHLLGR